MTKIMCVVSWYFQPCNKKTHHFAIFRWNYYKKTQHCWNTYIEQHSSEGVLFLRFIMSDTKGTGKPRIEHPRWRCRSFILRSLRENPITCTQVYAPCWSRVREERWSIGCRRGCPGAHRSLVKPSTFLCTTDTSHFLPAHTHTQQQ